MNNFEIYKYKDLTERFPEEGAEMTDADRQIEEDAVTQMADDEFHDLFHEAVGELSDDQLTKLQVAFLKSDDAEFGRLAQSYYMDYVRKLREYRVKVGKMI